MAKRPVAGGRRGERGLSQIPITPANAEAAADKRFSNQLFSIGMQGQEMLDEIAVTDAAEAGTTAGLDINGFRKRRDKTLSGRAFNRAALRSFQSELSISAQKRQGEIFAKFKNDPAKLKDAMNGHRLGIESQLQGQFPEAVPDFRAGYERTATVLNRQAADEHLRVKESEAAATSNEFLEGLQESAETIAFTTVDDADATLDVAEERKRLISELMEYGPKSEFEVEGRQVEGDIDRLEVYTPEQMQKVLASFDTQMIEKRILGKFERATNKAAFLDRFNKRLGKADRVQGLTIDETNTIAASMRARVRAEAADANASLTLMKDEVRDAIKLLGKGRNPAGLAKLQAATTGTKLEAPLAMAVNLAEYTNTIRTGTPAALDQELEFFDDNPPTTVAEQARFESVTETKNEMETALKNDPIAWADDAGGMDIEPIDPSDPASLARRAADVEKVNARYGINAPAFTDTEADQVSQAWDQGAGADRMGIAQVLVESLPGELATETLAQLDKKLAPGFAFVGEALADATPENGGVRVATLATQGMDVIRNDPAIVPKGSGNSLDDQLRLLVGNAYGGSRQHQKVILDQATNIYAAIASNNGDLSGDLNLETANTAIQLASGGILDYEPPGGPKVLGIEIPFLQPAPRRTVAPAPGVTAEQFETWLGGMDVSDVKRWGGAKGFSPDTVVARIQSGAWRLVSRGAGKYTVMAETLETDLLGQEYAAIPRRDGKGLFMIDWNDTADKFDPFDEQE